MRLSSAHIVCALVCVALGSTAVDAKGRRKAVSPTRQHVDKPSDATPGRQDAGRAWVGTAGRRKPIASSNDAGGEPIDPAAGEPAEVRALLEAHPNSNLIICLAGCGPAGTPTVVHERPHDQSVLAEAVALATPSMSQASVQQENSGDGSKISAGPITCLAGCNGPVGMSVYTARPIAH